ncbi:alpha/beta hydrolase [Azospirillum sp. ST 5-10]|uniref:alpha/beta hydrolase n=1 Tax=unclassified Azospirillum TaxID=2630922 RepID=UPI003F4A192E
MMTLELLSRRPAAPAPTLAGDRPPLLFVHGAFSGAWIWDATFLDWFAAHGWEAHAVSLRGHGNSDGRERLRWHGLDDYVDDVLATVERLAAAPVLIGHSMGGLVVQRALLRRPAPAAVLMASAPPHGVLEAAMGLFWRDPYAAHQMGLLMACGSRCVDPEGIRRAMFSDRVSAAEARRYEPLLQEESQRVLFETAVWNPFPAVPDPAIPVLVMGAGKDVLIPPDQVRSTARLLRTDPRMFPGMGHAMMLEPGWEEVAGAVHDWLEATLPAAPSAGAEAGAGYASRAPRKPVATM